MVQWFKEAVGEIKMAETHKHRRLKGKKLNFVYDDFEIFEKKCKHSFCLSLSLVAYEKNFKWYEPPLVIDKETNM